MVKSSLVRVNTMDAELEFSILSSTTAKQLFDQVISTLGVREYWYFGLSYTDASGRSCWLRNDKKVLHEASKKKFTLDFKFLVKYFPEDVGELIEASTKKYMCLQTHDAIVSGRWYCQSQVAVLLASYFIHAKYGDYEESAPVPLQLENLLPSSVLKQHNMSAAEWQDHINDLHKDASGVTATETHEAYLRLAQDLDMFGVTYADIKNKKNTPLLIGVDALGLNIYPVDNKITPKINFPWCEIGEISFNNTRFTIKPTDRKATPLSFTASDSHTAKEILSLCIGNHELYTRRRKPDTIEVQQMKMQAEQARKAIWDSRKKLNREIQAREEAERNKKASDERMLAMKEDMERRDKQLVDAQNNIRLLKLKLQEVENAKTQLETNQAELKSMMERLEQSKEMEQAEKNRLQQEIEEKQQQVNHVMEEMDARQSEAQRLQQEVEEMRQAQAAQLELEQQQRQQHVAEPDDTQEQYSTTLEHTDDGDHLENRRTTTEESVPLQEKLQKVNALLTGKCIQENKTELDQIHSNNMKEGRNKYKTLREIRKGNTKRRVDTFENL